MTENVNKEGAIYVMKIIGEKGLRIGVYSTSKEAREKQVKGGIGIPVKIIWDQELSSKAHALAAEALVHLYLAKHERIRQVGKRRIQIFECSENLATKSCNKAIELIDSSDALPASKRKRA